MAEGKSGGLRKQIIHAEQRYVEASELYDEMREGFRLGDVDKDAYNEAFENKMQAHAELAELKHEHI
jgi:hypothetical protein